MKQKVGRKIVALFTMCCMLFMEMPAFAAKVIQTTDLMDGVLELKPEEWTNTTLKIPESITNITIRGNGSVYSGLSIEAENRSTALDVTIQDLKINGGNIDIATSDVSNTLHLIGENTIISGGDKAAVTVRAGKTLTIDAADVKQSLIAVGGNGGAGIGADNNVKNGTGNIIIKNGKITATGNGGAAGIGQCYQPNEISNGNISILGGVIEATGSDKAAGIGGSNNGAIGKISISGATVTATGGNGGAGIGAGTKSCGDITITGGAYILAQGNGGGAGIGGGTQSEANVNDILIDGATIEAYGSNTGGAGIGGGNAASFKKLTIQQSNNDVPTKIIKAQGGSEAAGIGIGRTSNIADSLITISGGTICNAIGGDYGAGIGGGDTRSQKVTITDGVIEKAQGGIDAAGIGGGRAGKDHQPISITGGKVYAVAGVATDSSKGPVNDTGSGRCENVNDEKNDAVTIKNADVFLDGNTIRGITSDSTAKEVVFTLYDTWSSEVSSRVLCTKNKVSLRAIDNETNKNLIMDGEYDVKTGSKVYARIELGSVTSTNIDIDQVFHKYWFQYDTDTNIPMIGHPATTSGGWNITATPDATHEEAGVTIVDTYIINKIEMDIEFKPGTVANSGVTITGFNDDMSGIIPFSTSCISFEIPKITNSKFKKLEKAEVVIDLTGKPIEFDVSKWQVGVFEKVGTTTQYEYKKDLAEELKNKISYSGKKIKLEYPTSILEDGKYKIAIYLPTKYFTTATKPEIQAYQTNYVIAGAKLEIPINFDVNMKVLTTQELTIPGVSVPIEVNNVTVTENETGNRSLNIPYKEITKIS